MSEFWTVTENPAGYGKLERPLEYMIETELEASDSLTLLDVGSSNGAALSRLVDHLESETDYGIESINLDPQEVIYEDQRMDNSGHCVRGMIGDGSVPLRDDSIDMVVSNYLLPFIGRKNDEEFPGEAQSNALNEIHDVLRPGGVIGLHVDPAPGNEDSVSGHWVLNYDDFTELKEDSSDFVEYPVTPERGTNRFYSDNRDSLPNGFYDEFRDRLGL